jgi:hypothetical protein
MTPPIERIRYYDGEYLRATDFETEQEYHIEMRRRLNMGLHLHGIVEGLNVTTTTVGSVPVSSISAGLGIDHYGRELFLLAPYALGDWDLTQNGVTTANKYNLWLTYQKTAATPPQDGYGTCNNSPQLTRWQEGCSVAITPLSSQPSGPLLPTDPQSDDATADNLGVWLGVVQVLGPPSALFIAGVDQTRCRYIGLRAQRIQSPSSTGTNTAQFDSQFAFVPASGDKPLLPETGVEVAANLFAVHNIAIGENFAIDNTATPLTQPSPTATTVFPAPTGNLKVASDVFLQGNLYLFMPKFTTTSASGSATTPAQWIELTALLKQMVTPDIHMGSFSIGVSTTGALVVTTISGPQATANTTASIGDGICTITLTPALTAVGTPAIVAGISGVILNATQNDVFPGGTVPPTFFLQTVTASPTGVVSITWHTAPNPGTNATAAVQGMTITYIVVFTAA